MRWSGGLRVAKGKGRRKGGSKVIGEQETGNVVPFDAVLQSGMMNKEHITRCASSLHLERPCVGIDGGM